jgi:hypothetical protein
MRSWLIDDSDSVIVGQRASTRVKILRFVRLSPRDDSVAMKLEISGVIFRGLSIFFKPPSSMLSYSSFSTKAAYRLIKSSMPSMNRRCLIPIPQIATMNGMAVVNL